MARNPQKYVHAEVVYPLVVRFAIPGEASASDVRKAALEKYRSSALAMLGGDGINPATDLRIRVNTTTSSESPAWDAHGWNTLEGEDDELVWRPV